jgi:hypothetical protein
MLSFMPREDGQRRSLRSYSDCSGLRMAAAIESLRRRWRCIRLPSFGTHRLNPARTDAAIATHNRGSSTIPILCGTGRPYYCRLRPQLLKPGQSRLLQNGHNRRNRRLRGVGSRTISKRRGEAIDLTLELASVDEPCWRCKLSNLCPCSSNEGEGSYRRTAAPEEQPQALQSRTIFPLLPLFMVSKPVT